MKTAISIPDPIFEAAEKIAHRLALSRSELYAKAVQAFLEANDDEGITQALNEVYAEETSDLDPVLARLQAIAIARQPW